MADRTVSRIPISLKKEDREDLFKLKSLFERQLVGTASEGREIPIAEVMRMAIKIALTHTV